MKEMSHPIFKASCPTTTTATATQQHTYQYPCQHPYQQQHNIVRNGTNTNNRNKNRPKTAQICSYKKLTEILQGKYICISAGQNRKGEKLGIAGPRSIEDRCGTAAGGCLSIDRNICLLKSKEGVGKRSGTNVQTNSGNVNSNNMGYYHNQKGCNKNVSIDSRRTNMNTNSNTNASINTNINTNTNTCINNYINSNTLTDNNNNNISNKNIGSTQHKQKQKEKQMMLNYCEFENIFDFDKFKSTACGNGSNNTNTNTNNTNARSINCNSHGNSRYQNKIIHTSSSTFLNMELQLNNTHNNTYNNNLISYMNLYTYTQREKERLRQKARQKQRENQMRKDADIRNCKQKQKERRRELYQQKQGGFVPYALQERHQNFKNSPGLHTHNQKTVSQQILPQKSQKLIKHTPPMHKYLSNRSNNTSHYNPQNNTPMTNSRNHLNKKNMRNRQKWLMNKSNTVEGQELNENEHEFEGDVIGQNLKIDSWKNVEQEDVDMGFSGLFKKSWRF